MIDSALIFVYHLGWGVFGAVVLSFSWALKVATEATVSRDATGVSTTVTRVNRGELLRTWTTTAAITSGFVLVGMLLWQMHGQMVDSGRISGFGS